MERDSADLKKAQKDFLTWGKAEYLGWGLEGGVVDSLTHGIISKYLTLIR